MSFGCRYRMGEQAWERDQEWKKVSGLAKDQDPL
jgi:hypothetical protein